MNAPHLVSKRFVIYCHTNSVTGLRYVGQTEWRATAETPDQAVVERWRTGYKTCRRFFNSVCKHGIGNFTSEVLEVVDGQDVANEVEQRWITELGTVHPGGYNLDFGGGVSPRHPETRQKMREAWAERSPEQRSETARKAMMSLPPEQRVAMARKASEAASAKLTPEQKRENMLRARDARTPEHIEKHKEAIRAANRAKSPEVRRLAAERGGPKLSKIAKERWAAVPEAQRAAVMADVRKSLTHEVRSRAASTLNASRTPEQRAEISRRARAAITPEQLSERARKRSANMTPERRKEIAAKATATKLAKAAQKGEP
jgi:hypothetical protein